MASDDDPIDDLTQECINKMAQVSIQDFPQELVDEVIDRIAPDNMKDSLRALSLVSQSFRPRCQKRLFTSVTIKMKSTGQQYRSRYPDQNSPPARSLATKLLVALIDSPHLALYTTDLTILNDEDTEYEIPEGQSAQDIIPQILPLYQNLQKFVLRQEEKYRPQTAPAILQAVSRTLQLPSLVHVELKDIPINIIQYCSPSVKHVAFWNPLHQEDLTAVCPENLHAQSRLSLQSLLVDDASHIQMSGDRNEVAIRWVLQQQPKLDLTHLRKLRISAMHCELSAHVEVANLLRVCAGSLEELSFTPSLIAFEYRPQPPDDPIKLNILTSLRNIHLGVQTGFWRDGSDMYDPIPWISRLFDPAPPSNRIEVIAFSSSYGMLPTATSTVSSSVNYFGPDFTSYPQLDRILATGKFPQLRQVRFHVEEAPFYKDYLTEPHTFQVRATWIKSHIRTSMAKLKRANLVRFSSSLPPYSVKLLLDSDW